MTENEFPTAPKWAESAKDYKQTATEFPNQCTQEVMNIYILSRKAFIQAHQHSTLAEDKRIKDLSRILTLPSGFLSG